MYYLNFNYLKRTVDTDSRCKVSNFAEDTEEDCTITQQDLNKSFDWSEKWQMYFNVNKCKVITL